MNENPESLFNELSPEQQERILANNKSFEASMENISADEYAQMVTQQNQQRIKALEEELERRATSHPADRIDERLKQPEIKCDDLTPYGKYMVLAADQCDIPHVSGIPDPPLTFDEYQAGATRTAIYNRDARVLYPALGLPGEVGEVLEKATNLLMMAVHSGKLANQVKKIIRDDNCECDTPRKHDIGKEIGGVLWYCAAVASDLGLSLSDIARENLDVLASRQERGTLKGDGDNR
jgi:NTP pyrophosphatase (non-canonical NTP hydrolase)